MEDFIEYDSFIITDKPQEKYKGVYKNAEVIKGIRFFDKEGVTYYEKYEKGDVLEHRKVSLLDFQHIFKTYLENKRKEYGVSPNFISTAKGFNILRFASKLKISSF